MSLGNSVIVVLALVALVGGLTFILAACRVSGRISEMERQQASQPNDNNELSFGNETEDNNAL